MSCLKEPVTNEQEKDDDDDDDCSYFDVGCLEIQVVSVLLVFLR